MRTLVPLALAVLVSACASQHELARCKGPGPVLALNASHWQPSADEMEALERACQETR